MATPDADTDTDTDTDTIVERILTTYPVITVVGASTVTTKAAHYVPAHMQSHGWRIIPVNPHADEVLGETVFRTLADVPEPVGLVNVFRPSPPPRHRPAGGRRGGDGPLAAARHRIRGVPADRPGRPGCSTSRTGA